MHIDFIRRAIAIAEKSIDSGGGPFGAVIVKDGIIIAEATNMVTVQNDPTAHAEILAIRKAGEILENFDLSSCTLYSSCEPCPMCLGAIYWARISGVYFAADRKDAEEAGFDDSLIYKELAKPIDSRQLNMVQLGGEEAVNIFKKWNDKSDKTAY